MDHDYGEFLLREHELLHSICSQPTTQNANPSRVHQLTTTYSQAPMISFP